MDRNRDSRRTNNVSSSSRRRSRGSFREPSGVSEVEDGVNEIHDSSARLRDRSSNGGKKDRSSRRRRLNSNDSFHIDRDEVAEGSTDDSMEEDQEEEDEPVRSVNLRRTSAAASTTTTNRIKPPWKASDEMIGVSVPRKARSACAKRSHEPSSSVFGMGGGSSMLSDGLMHQPSSSSPVRNSAASVSPPSSNASVRAGKRVKPVIMKNKPPKTAKQVSISESEVEVARFLYGLTRPQAHPSPSKQDNFQSSSPKNDSKQHSSNEGSASGASKASSPVSSPVSPRLSSQHLLLQHSSSTPATVMAPKRKKPRPVKLEDSGSNTMLACSSIPPGSSCISNSMSPNAVATATKIEADKDSQATKMEVLSPRSEKNAGVADGDSSKLKPSSHISSPLQTASQILTEEKMSSPSSTDSKPLPSMEKKQPATAISTRTDDQASDTNCQAPVDQNALKQSSPTGELAATSGPDSKLEDKKITSPVSTADEGLHVDKFKIDLMALPTNSSLESDDVPETTEKNVTQSSDLKSSSIFEEIASNDKEVVGETVKVETEANVRPGFNVTDAEEKTQTKETTEKIDLEKQFIDERNNGPNHDENILDKAGNKQQSQRPKSAARQTERAVPAGGVSTSTSTPTLIPAALPSWHGGLPPLGYMGSSPANISGVPSLHGATPVEGNSAMPNAPFVMVPPARTSRCATHCYIARLILSQQQLERFNPFWAATGSANFYGAKPYNLNILPNSDARMMGGSSTRNSTPLSHNRPHNGLGSGSVVSLNGHKPKENFPQRDQAHFPQSAQQGPSFIFPVIQSKTGGTKSGNLTDNAGLLPAPAAAAAATGSSGTATVNSNFSNLAAGTSDPQYLAFLHGNYPFPIPPPYRPHIGQQQQPQPVMHHGLEFVRPFYPSQLLQFQPQSLPQSQNPATSTGSSSSQKRLQPQHCFSTAKPPLDSREPTGNGEDGADSRTSLAQKKLPTQYFPGNPALNPNFSQNFAIIAAAMGGKQQQLQNDANPHMGFKGMEVNTPIPPSHSVLQSLPELNWHHYQIPAQPLQLPDQFQNSGANQAKTTGKVTARSGSDKSPESSRSQAAAAVSASQQLQKQALTRTNDANLHMSYKGIEVTAPVPAGHSVLHGLPELNRHHYQIPGQPLHLVDQFQIPGSNQAKTAGKVTARSSDRSPESGGRSQASASSAHQFQKQSLGRANDANFHMSLRGMEMTGSAPPGHSVLQSLPEPGRHHYQLPGQPVQFADQFHIPGANHAKSVGKVKSPESSRPQTGVASAADQFQKQAPSRAKSVSTNSSPTPTSGMISEDRIPVSYSNSGMRSSTGLAVLPNMPGPQWRMQQRTSSPAGSPGNSAIPAQPPPKGPLPGQSVPQQTGQATTGSLAGKPGKPVSSPRNSVCKSTPAGPALLAQSGQAQNPTKNQLLQHQIQSQQLFFPSSEPMFQHSGAAAGLYQKRQVMPSNQPTQAIFSPGLNQRRPSPQSQSAPALALANAGAYLGGGGSGGGGGGGGGKGPAGYNPLGGSSAAVMAASYTQSASNLPVKSGEQKPAAA